MRRSTSLQTDFSYFFVGCEKDRTNCEQHIPVGIFIIPKNAGKPTSAFWENTRLAVEMFLPIDAIEPSRHRKDIRKTVHLVSYEWRRFKGAMPKIGTYFHALLVFIFRFGFCSTYRCFFSWVIHTTKMESALESGFYSFQYTSHSFFNEYDRISCVLKEEFWK